MLHLGTAERDYCFISGAWARKVGERRERRVSGSMNGIIRPWYQIV